HYRTLHPFPTRRSSDLALPITIGGSGLAELGIWAYISNLSGIPTLNEVVNDDQLKVIIAWRIATYHVPLVIMWVALMRLAIGRVDRKSTRLNSSHVKIS